MLCIGIGKLQSQNQTCKFDQVHQNQLLVNEQYEKNTKLIREAVAQQSLSVKTRTNTIYSVPVVVHVLHKGEAIGIGSNISDDQINSAINNLTDAYRNNGYGGVDVEIEFCLANLDPGCSSSSGIIRIDGTGTCSSGGSDCYETTGITDANEEQIKALSKFPNDQYYNIWVVSEIDNNNAGAGIQGYAYFPGASPKFDGAVVLHNAFGYDPDGSNGYNLKSYTNMNNVLIHETGHFFNLYHTFQGDGGGSVCPSNSNCGSNGDEICDTDPHIRSANNCPTGTNPCTGQPYGDLIKNFMDYSNQNCVEMYTADQAMRQRVALEVFRPGLTASIGCATTTPNKSSAALSCQPESTKPLSSAGMGIDTFELGSISYYSNLTKNDGLAYGNNGYVETCASTDLAENGNYTAVISNGNINNENVNLYIDFNNDGDFLDAQELVGSSTNGLDHTINFTIPSGGIMNMPLWCRVISDWVGDPISGPCDAPQYGQVEDYTVRILPALPVELTDYKIEKINNESYISWKTASELNNEKFVIEHSVNGKDFEFLAEIDGNGNSSEANDYRYIDKKPHIGQQNYYRLSQFDFDGTQTFYGIKSLFYETAHYYSITPNPFLDYIDIQFYSEDNSFVKLNIFSSNGQLVSTEEIDLLEGINQMNCNMVEYESGLYILQIETENKVFNQRVVKL